MTTLWNSDHHDDTRIPEHFIIPAITTEDIQKLADIKEQYEKENKKSIYNDSPLSYFD